MGYYSGAPVNSIDDYTDLYESFDPYDPNVKVPVQWKAPPPVRVRHRRPPVSGLAGMEGISDSISAVKQFALSHFGLLLVLGVGAYWLWSRREK